MAKKLKKHLEVSVPLYGVVFMCFPNKEAETKWLGYEDMNDNYAAQVSVGKSDQGVEYVSMCFRSIDEYCTETLTHECVHAAWRVLEIVGITVSVDNQEPLAYLTGWLSRQVNNFMMPHVEATAE